MIQSRVKQVRVTYLQCIRHARPSKTQVYPFHLFYSNFKAIILGKRGRFTKGAHQKIAKKRNQTPQESQLGQYEMTYCEKSEVYEIDFLNSISLHNGKIYNLIKLSPDSFKQRKKDKCRCSKSMCKSRYCECVAQGHLCGIDCQCTNCNNIFSLVDKLKLQMEGSKQFKGCRCQKSRCSKKYCQCFSIGQQCSEKCKCMNCKNVNTLQDALKQCQQNEKKKKDRQVDDTKMKDQNDENIRVNI